MHEKILSRTKYPLQNSKLTIICFPDNTLTAMSVKSRINITQNITRQVKNQAYVRRYFPTSIKSAIVFRPPVPIAADRRSIDHPHGTDYLIPNGPKLSGLVHFNELSGDSSFLFFAFDSEPSLILFLKSIEFRVPNAFQYFSKFFDA
jgi:hypothetical protein